MPYSYNTSYNLQISPQFNNCNANISICHAFNCKKGGIITTRHNDISDGGSELEGKSFNSLHVHNRPLIHTGNYLREGKAHPKGSQNNSPVDMENSEKKGDILICDLCQRGTDIIHNMCVMNTDTLSNWNESPEKCLQTAEKENKKNYLESCIYQ